MKTTIAIKNLASILMTALAACVFLAGSSVAQGGPPGPGAEFATFGASEANVLMEGFGETNANGEFLTTGDYWFKTGDGEWQRDVQWRKEGKDIVLFSGDGEDEIIISTFKGAAASPQKSGEVTNHLNSKYDTKWERK